MAAINCEQQQEFALHSLNEEYKNKTFVFVKLTDSALKSIEDYMSLNPNLRQNIAKPTIQFQTNSNQGAITLPLTTNQQQSNNSSSNKNEIRYSFNLSNVDADNPGSFEFLRQRKANKYEECIESLGSMFIKMQIHASDDIYQKTKVKMANAELDAKKHSTKVIKETGPNVGRKIKKTIINTGVNTLLNSGNNSLSLSGNTLNDLQSSAYSSYKDLLNNNNVNSTFETSNQQNSPKSSTSKFNNLNSKLTNSSKDDINSNSIKESLINSSNQQNSNNQKSSTVNPELLRKPIRDRVIHLLALRPFKKPEMHAKLNRDGLREKDKKGLGVLLSQIANLKDNAYHLHRGAWHEVQVDDWPFYTFEERELVRKRNPLLTTTTTATTSSTSNLLNANSSNNSISAIKDNYSSISPLANFDNQQSPQINSNSSPSNKRTIDSTSSSNQMNGNISNTLDYDYATANKKQRIQRISHHKTNSEQAAIKKRSPPLSSSTNNTVMNNNTSLINNSSINQTIPAGRSSNNLLNSNNSNKKLTSSSLQVTNKYDDVINIWENKPKTPDEQLTNGHSSNNNSNLTNSHSSPESVNSKLLDRTAKKSGLNNISTNNNYRSGANSNSNNSTTTVADRYHHSTHLHNQTLNNYHSNQSSYHSNNATNSSHFNINSFTNHHHHHYSNSNQQHNSSLCSTPNSSPDSGTGSNDGSLSTSSSRSSNSGLNVDSQADYLSKYTEITSIEQFRKYKQDFNCEYEEYKKLHNIVDRNSNKFALLEQELRQAQEGTDSWNRIMERILREYEEIKRDNTYLNARNRMQYLHMKLSHIKSLILNFQNLQYRKHGVSNRNSTGANCNSSSIKFNSLNSNSGSRIRSRNHNSVPVQQANRSKMITSS